MLRLKELREAKGLSMKEIARQMGSPCTTADEEQGANRDFEYIRENVSLAELLAALAEEATEMSQAALKARRALTRENPTPKSFERCIQDLTEEISDVMVCAEALELNPNHAIMALKRERWVIRLEDREG